MSSSSSPTRKPAGGPKTRASMSKSTLILVYVVMPILIVSLICSILTLLVITSIISMPAFLSTLVKYFLAITAPLLPFLLAGLVGFAMKVWKRRAFGGRTTWLMILGGQIGQHVGRVVRETMDMGKLFTAWGGDGLRLDELLLGVRGWVQWGLIMFVVWGEVMGRRWDAGYVEKWVDGLVEEENEKYKGDLIVDEEMGGVVDQKVDVGGAANEDMKSEEQSEKDSEKVDLL